LQKWVKKNAQQSSETETFGDLSMSIQDLVHQTLGHYRIEAPLDAGGMGQVFRGRHIYLGRLAAVKVMRPHLAAEKKFRELFLQEARSAARLKHPNILDIYEFGEQDGRLYLVMELMTGGSVRTLLQASSDQARPLALGLDLVRQAAEGLAAAHADHVIHQDIKPDNLLLNRVPEPLNGYATYDLKVSDFGLARLAEGRGPTGTGGMMGTLAYMSPEQCQNSPLDGRSDLYSLGIVLYEVVTGSLPFRVEGVVDAHEMHIEREPLAPSKVRLDLPPMLDEVVLRCLAKKPEDRYQNGMALACVLRQMVEVLDQNELTASLMMPLVREDRPITMSSQVEVPAISPQVSSLLTPSTAIVSSVGASEHIGISVEPKTLTLVPGQTAEVRIRLTNTGPLVDWFTVSVEDVPASWITLLEAEVQLNPGMQEVVEITVQVPRSSEYRAQEYKALIRATSYENPKESALAQMRWRVQPFMQGSLALRPKRARGRGQARYQLLLSNRGNGAAQYTLQGEDDEGQMSYQFERDCIELEQGTGRDVPLQVRLKKHWVGIPRHYPFQIHAHPAGDRGEIVSSRGEFINQPIIPVWLLSAICIVLIGALVVASLMGVWPFSDLKPGIAFIPTTVGQGTTPVAGMTPTSRPNSGMMPTPTSTLTPGMTPTPTKVTPTPASIGQTPSPKGGSTQPLLKWAMPPGAIDSSPTVVNGVLYIGSWYTVYALDASTGQQKWTFPTGNRVESSPTVQSGVLYVGSQDGNVYALDASTGQQKWVFPTGAGVDSSPLVQNGVLYVGSSDHNVYALDASTGQKKWAFLTGDRVYSSPTVVNGVLYIASQDDHVYALDASTGQQKWVSSKGGSASSPKVFNGVLYIGSGDHKIYALDANTGREIWTFSTGDGMYSSPTVVNGVLYIGSYDHKVYALDASTGQKKWVFQTLGIVRSSPTVQGGVLYIGSGDGSVAPDDHNLYALDASTGQQKWVFPTGGYVRCSPKVFDGVLYFGSGDGKIYALILPAS
jgi:outer membrane protein assembly factor BamB/serine/threonine protein kinase